MTQTTLIKARAESEAFRFVLRRATRSEHESLDAHPAFAAMMGGTLDLGGYGRLMEMFHAFYACHDPILADGCQRHGLSRTGFTYAWREPILAADLAALGQNVSAPRIRLAPSLAPDASVGRLAGALYVLEGSLLGGGMLCRAVEKLFAAGPSGVRQGHDGYGYWAWCREAGGRRWAMTCSMLEQVATTPAAESEMVAGARQTFADFAEWLAPWDAAQRPQPIAENDAGPC